MCQLCQIKPALEADRWPTPLQSHVDELKALVPTAHVEVLAYQAEEKARRAEARSTVQTTSSETTSPTKTSSSTDKAPPEQAASSLLLQNGSSPITTTVNDSPTSINSHSSTPPISIAPLSTLAHPLQKLKTTFQLLYMVLTNLSRARTDWFHSAAKMTLRRTWTDVGDYDKVQRMQVINNKCDEAVEKVRGIMARFVKWNLGLEEGLDAFCDG